MSIVSQILDAASVQADSHAVEIIEKAKKNLAHSRFQRIRRKKAIPQTPLEEAYLYALNKYVYHKIYVERAVKTGWEGYVAVSYERGAMNFWREAMDRIEYLEEIPETVRIRMIEENTRTFYRKEEKQRPGYTAWNQD